MKCESNRCSKNRAIFHIGLIYGNINNRLHKRVKYGKTYFLTINICWSIFVKEFYYYVGLNFCKFTVFIKQYVPLNSHYRFLLGKLEGNICCQRICMDNKLATVQTVCEQIFYHIIEDLFSNLVLNKSKYMHVLKSDLNLMPSSSQINRNVSI